jgi:hypothetical protein
MEIQIDIRELGYNNKHKIIHQVKPEKRLFQSRRGRSFYRKIRRLTRKFFTDENIKSESVIDNQNSTVKFKLSIN